MAAVLVLALAFRRAVLGCVARVVVNTAAILADLVFRKLSGLMLSPRLSAVLSCFIPLDSHAVEANVVVVLVAEQCRRFRHLEFATLSATDCQLVALRLVAADVLVHLRARIACKALDKLCFTRFNRFP